MTVIATPSSGAFKIVKTSVPISMYLGKGQEFSPQRLSELILAIDNYSGEKKVISLVSAYVGEGCSEMSFELALAISSIGKRVLIVDSNPTDLGVFREMRYNLASSLNEIVLDASANTCSVLHVGETNLYYTSFCKGFDDRILVQDQDRLDKLFLDIRQQFDYVFVISEANDGLPLAKAAQLSDVSVVVVEAERARRPVVAQVIEALKANGCNLLGTVLNRRQLYIPPRVYSLLYK